MKKIGNSLLLVLTALIWGLAFIAQSEGMKYIGPFTFNGLRMIIGGIVLIPFVFIFKGEKNRAGNIKMIRKETFVGGIACGAVLFLASSLQQYALIETSPGKAGFLTALYIVIVPILGCFMGNRPSFKLAVAVAASLVGLYFLCFDGSSLAFEVGDILLIISALLFSVHILIIDRFSPRADAVGLSCLQFLVCGVISLVPMFTLEHVSLSAVLEAKSLLLYAGVLSCGAGYTFQIIGQKSLDPTVASLILSLESVFALLGEFVYGYIVGEPAELSAREIFGCAIVFLAIVLAQLPDKREKLGKNNY